MATELAVAPITGQMTKVRLSGTEISEEQEQELHAQRKRRLIELLHKAASKAVQEEDPWAKYNLPAVPAERVIRHLYDPYSQTWHTDETIVKMEAQPFTNGAMRFCYRMKKRAQPPRSATNHRFHKHGWSRASNYIAKCYQMNGQIDTSDAAKRAIQNDIILQYEAQKWAERFNDSDPPSKISFLRAYAVEFPSRPGRPWMAVERFIAGRDWYGAGFVKHNTNSGFVDTELRRVTPQVFSAHSFYASQGERLVADIQGVGDLYTDPQVLSSDYRFGEGDLGPRGMALFFNTFRHCGIADAMGIPIFSLSKNELKCQAKYHDDELSVEVSTVHDDDDHDHRYDDHHYNNTDELSHKMSEVDKPINIFQKLDLNRIKRRSSLLPPAAIHSQILLEVGVGSGVEDGDGQEQGPIITANSESDVEDVASVRTEKRSNLTTKRADIRTSLRKSFISQISPARLKRTSSDVDEVEQCLTRARQHWKVDLVRDYHRTESGELRRRQFRGESEEDKDDGKENGNNNAESSITKVSTIRHKSALIGTISPPMKITKQTRINLGKVHYQLAVLHGLGRFPEVVPGKPYSAKNAKSSSDYNDDEDDDDDDDIKPPHDSFSVLFHLSYAASLQNAPACLSLGRVHAGLGTHVSGLLDNTLVPLDFDAAKDLLRRAMETFLVPDGASDKTSILVAPAAPRVAAGCLLFQVLQDERLAGLYHTIEEEEEDEEDGQGAASFPVKKDNAVNNTKELMQVAEDTLRLFELMEKQQVEAEKVKGSLARIGTVVSGPGNGLQVGDRVEGDYFMEGTYYPGSVVEVSKTETESGGHKLRITVQYDDDGSSESLPEDHVRLLIPPTTTQTNLGGPLSDDEAFGTGEDQDDKIPIMRYELLAELAELKHEAGDRKAASEYYQQAAEGAMQQSKMKIASEWSLKAAELQE